MNAPETLLAGKNKSTKIQGSKHERVLLTGISGSLGQRIAHHLHKDVKVLGVDLRPFPRKPKDVELHALDLRRKSAYELLKKKKPDTILHVGVIRNPAKHVGNGSAYYFNLEITNQLLRLAEELQVRKFIFLSTANLYGPSPLTQGFLSEDAPLHGADRSPEMRDLVALDMMIQSFFWKQPQIETVILRPVHIIGRHLNNAPSRYLQLQVMPSLMGYDPMIQLIDEDDLTRSIGLALASNTKGVFNITGSGQAPLSRIASSCNQTLLPLPETLFRPAMKMAFRYKMSTFIPGELDHLKYTCLVDGARAKKELGYEAKVPLKKSLKNLQRRSLG